MVYRDRETPLGTAGSVLNARATSSTSVFS